MFSHPQWFGQALVRAQIDAGDHILTMLHALQLHRDPQQAPRVFTWPTQTRRTRK